MSDLPANLGRCRHCRRIVMRFRLKGDQCRDRFDCACAFGLWWRANYGVEIPPDVILDDEGMPAEPVEAPVESVKRVVAVNAPPPTVYEPYAALPSVQGDLDL